MASITGSVARESETREEKAEGKTSNPRVLITVKERAELARRHWDEHYGRNAAKVEASDVWAAAAYIPDSTTEAAITLLTTPPHQPSTTIHGHFNPNPSDSVHILNNFPTILSLSPIVSESDKTFFLNMDSDE